MRNTLIGLASLLGLALFPDIAGAQSNTAIGVGTGAVTGAVAIAKEFAKTRFWLIAACAALMVIAFNAIR